MGRPKPRAVLQMQVPQGFQDHAAPPSTLFSTPWWCITPAAILALAANRKDLRISTDRSLKSLSSRCNCQLQIQFPAITVWLLPTTQTNNPTYSYTEAHKAPVSLPEATQNHSRTWKLYVFLMPQQQQKCWVGLITRQNSRGGTQRDTTSQIPEHWPVSPALSSYPLISFWFLNLNQSYSNLKSQKLRNFLVNCSIWKVYRFLS